MRMKDDTGLKRMFSVLRKYDDGVIRTVAARKKLEIAELDVITHGTEPTREQAMLRRYLEEDMIVYETVAFLLSVPEDDFERTIDEVGPAMKVDLEPVARSVMDKYRRGLSDLDLKMEDRAAGYVDDILGIVNGSCTY